MSARGMDPRVVALDPTLQLTLATWQPTWKERFSLLFGAVVHVEGYRDHVEFSVCRSCKADPNQDLSDEEMEAIEHAKRVRALKP